LFLLDDYGVYADEHGEVNRERIEAELTPLYSQTEWQALFPIVIAAWEPQWSARTFEWVAQWMARVWPRAKRWVHLHSNTGGPGRQSDHRSEGGEFESVADMWNLLIPHLHGYLLQDTRTFTGEEVGPGRTPEQQFVYDLMDKSRRFRYGTGGNAPSSGPEVEQWESVWGDDHKSYQSWDGSYLRQSADGQPFRVVGFEYASYVLKNAARADRPAIEARAQDWGDLARTVNGVTGYGDGGR
jgi:hypothetical protein